jgi:hypothetical protein
MPVIEKPKTRSAKQFPLKTVGDGDVSSIVSGFTRITEWKGYEKILFRIAFVFFVIMSIPTNPGWYENLFSLQWTRLNYRDIYDVARFSPVFLRSPQRWYSLMGYGDWFVVLFVAILAALIWTGFDRKRKEYNILYYWLRVIVRYRAGIGIIGFGFTKLFPVQMPYPSLGLLNTDFGDFTAQKIYWMSIGIVPWYQVFAGVVELSAGFLLFFRRTTTVGAILLLGALGDITYVNFAYDGGVHVYASYFVLFALFLLIYDAPKIYNLLIRERLTIPVYFYPSLKKRWQQLVRIGLKTATFAIFGVLLFYLQYINFRYDPYKQPSTKGLPTLRGNYRVTEFRINGREIPYSPLDPVRWQDVTFEKWTTLTYRVNKPVTLDLSNGGGSPMKDIERTFEVTGTAGGRRVFHYLADSISNTLYLQDKNTAGSPRRQQTAGRGNDALASGTEKQRPVPDWIPAEAREHIGDEKKMINPHAWSARRDREFAAKTTVKRNRMVLNYSTTDGAHVILSGINENKDSIYVVLDRVQRNYALTESKLQAGSY